ncbi:DUF885 domain-containing protein [Phenylobacterium sp.]|uniref:DUF885 domain-containing protein n=1 Tax=Phenylobacterium sp. TaxID=1871053 RepID=UPI002E302CAD|nr:DUF885 family protein [Phenylobacterium sp.]HEX4710950.1 DUF885 family protein [Phenylobacterium sp.]
MNQLDRRSFLATTAGAALMTAAPALAQTGSEDLRLRAKLDAMFETMVDDSPRFATSLGLDKGKRAALKSQLDDNSNAAKARRLERSRGWLKDLKAIDRAKLSASSKVDYDVVFYQQDEAVRNGDKWKFGDVGGNFRPYVISQQSGAYASVPDFLDSQHKVADAADAEAYLARLHAFAGSMDEDLTRQKADVAAGVIPADFICDLSIGQMKALRDQPAAQTILVASIVKKAKAANLPGDWEGRATKIVTSDIFPALDRQIAAMRAVRAKARPDVGAWALPNGEAYYADAVKASTTTNYTPEQVHQLGREQVAEISGRLDAILKGRGMTQGTVGARLMALNNQPDQVFPATDAGRAEMLKYLNDHIGEVYKRLPTAFNTLPKAKVEVRRVPVFIQDGAANGYYNSAAPDGSRPAAFYINLKETSDWPRYNLWTLAHHETVPGHHLQIALSQESNQIPALRRYGFGFSAYVEGWALYAEQLAQEMGANDADPWGEAGFLQSFLFRAARLVTDTGIHAKRWTRAQATQYMVDTIGNTSSRAQREVERYFAGPGQANSYKVGHTVWAKVRDESKARLGPKFDLKAYHDAVLLSGAMPLTVLERHVSEWVATQV